MGDTKDIVGQGILSQITNSNRIHYEKLTMETLSSFLRDLKDTSKYREFVVLLGDFGSRYCTALNNNDEVELEALELESFKEKIKRYKIITNNIKGDYDIVYMLSSVFDLKKSLNSDVVWGIDIEYNHENEYDDSYVCTELRWEKDKWVLETYYSDGWYVNEVRDNKEIKEVELFEFILKQWKKHL